MNVIAEHRPDWRHPKDEPPPKGVKLLILSPYGIAQTGDWYEGAAAWMPLPRIKNDLKERLFADGLLRR